MELLLYAAIFLFLLSVIALFGYRMYVRPAKVTETLASPMSNVSVVAISEPAEPLGYKVTKVLQWVGEKLPADPTDASLTRRILIAAGFYSDAALPVLIACRLLSALLFLAASLILVSLTQWRFWIDAVIVAFPPILGFWVPQFILEHLMASRQERLRLALPDALDMLVICVEAGISLDQALRKVSEELMITHPELCRELNLVSVEMRAGQRRAAALKNLADRTMEKEVGKLVAMLIQTDRFGTSVGDSLRAHSDFMRIRRRQEAEERAGKLGVKLIIPVFLFIMPATMVVSAGPAFLTIAKVLLPMMRGEM